MEDLVIDPPLINSSNPWATGIAQLRDLYECPFIGAITVRTSTLAGFAHDDSIHQYGLFDPSFSNSNKSKAVSASLNTLGYSPIPLSQTLETIKQIILESTDRDDKKQKPVIVSITGATDEIIQSINLIDGLQKEIKATLLVEINLSCPNIGGKPPPAFTLEGLTEYLGCLKDVPSGTSLLIGVKTPPYSNPENFTILRRAFESFVIGEGTSKKLGIPLHFITATNTIGCSLLLDAQLKPQLNSADGTGIGGLAGAPLHALALGNVKLIRKLLDSNPALSHIQVIGIGGVSDRPGFDRMQAAGAKIVGVGTAFGVHGIPIFENILKEK
ncbi:FMN-linked oxidoreductase [Microthyrium microscopicum]|uniref:FMN-linked oxidoreductase n=1 Tax=Microthyrium microscopicum TaxID=703497 RepID=A0A6A6U7X0_9PEZI|nr:FMN-linked oxidoreductase [Microthyrium microscopicum]